MQTLEKENRDDTTVGPDLRRVHDGFVGMVRGKELKTAEQQGA
jgi:hypothetical protein